VNECWVFSGSGERGVLRACAQQRLANAEVGGGQGSGPRDVNGAPSRAVVDGSQRQGVEMTPGSGKASIISRHSVVRNSPTTVGV